MMGMEFQMRKILDLKRLPGLTLRVESRRTDSPHLPYGWLLCWMLFLGLAAPAYGQSVVWSPSSGSLQQGVTTGLKLVFSDCTPEEVELPDVPNLEFGTPSVSAQMRVVNFKMMRSAVYTYPVQAAGTGEVVIPEFQVPTSEGVLTVPEARYRVTRARVGGGGSTRPDARVPGGDSPLGQASPQLTVDDVVQLELDLGAEEAWAGEVLSGRIRLEALTRYLNSLRSFPEWAPPKLTLGPWQEHEESRGRVQGQEILRVDFPLEVMAPSEPGSVSLPPASISIGINDSSTDPFDRFFRNPRGKNVTVQSDISSLKVKPLPPTEKSFSGAVGTFELKSRIVPESVAVGEPVTWTLELSGRGNWPAGIRMPDRQVPEGFQVIQPKSKTDMADDSPFRGTLTEDLVLIPEKPGQFTIPSLEFTYFDPESGEYRTLTTPASQIEVTPAASGSVSLPPAGRSGGAGTTRSPLVAFDGQVQLPREPLGKTTHSIKPMGRSLWLAGICVPWLGLMAVWVVLAIRQVGIDDSSHSRRQALNDLKGLMGAPRLEDAVWLRQWREATAGAWGLAHPVPSSRELHKFISDEKHPGTADRWTVLWNEVEAVLFGSESSVPGDWAERAGQAVRELRVPRIQWQGVLNHRVWFPSLAFVFLIFGVPTGGQAAVSEGEEMDLIPQKTYQTGEFSRTEAALRLRLDENWNDWAAHHDLALALFQQERFDEAAAHAAIATLQNPRHPDVRWDALLFLERAGWQSTRPGRFLLSGHLLDQVARVCSVFFWQVWGLLGSAILALILLTRMVFAYRRKEMKPVLLWLPLGVGVLLLVGSMASLERWGRLGHPQAVVVVENIEGRSIPSEVDQQMRPVPIGTTGIILKPFLGWRQVELGNRELVWVGENDVVPIYHQR